MRFIDRSSLSPPGLLFDKEAERARSEVQNFISQTQSKGGTRRVPRPKWLDETKQFRKATAEHFNELCAYCESPASLEKSSRPGLICRHRPEALAQDEKGSTELLAYSWLIYDWENLLWSCADCARRKGNRFYIEGERGTPFMPISQLRDMEQELMLDPCYHDPTEHLAFQVDGSIKWTSPAGHATVDVLELNRSGLIERRRRAIAEIAERLRAQAATVHQTGLFGMLLASADNEEDLFPPHLGAATQAILGFARQRDMPFDGPKGFLELLSGLDARRRDDFIDAILDERVHSEIQTTTSGVEPWIPLPPSAPPPPSRIPNIEKLPTAFQPVTHVEIANFKVLRDISFDLPESIADTGQSPCMMLLGENAMGKSSVLEAMALAVIGSAEAAALDRIMKDEELSPIALIHRPDPFIWKNTAPEMHVRLDFLDTEDPVMLTAEAGDEAFSGSDRCVKVVLGYGPRRYFTTRPTRRFRAPAHRVQSLFDPWDMIANPIHWLAKLDDEEFFAAARALREVLMLKEEDDFERRPESDSPGQIYIRQNGQPITMKDLSVGFKSVIAMVCDIIREMLYHFDNLEFATAIVFIDEIETHLHPRWKMQIMTLLRRAFPKVQFVVSTHDPLCLRGMHDGEVFVLHRDPDTDRVERVEDLPSIKGMRAEQILTSEFFGLGSTDPETDAQLERFSRLAARHESLTEAEREEMELLEQQLNENMVLGTSLAEQAYAEALKEQDANRAVTPTRVPSPRRAQIKSVFPSMFDRERGQ